MFAKRQKTFPSGLQAEHPYLTRRRYLANTRTISALCSLAFLFCFLAFLCLSLSFPLSRIAIYSYLVTYVRTYIYHVAARVSFLFSVPTTLCFGRTTRRLFQTMLIIIDLETRRSFDLRRKEIMVRANCVHIDKMASEDANDRILFVSCFSFSISLGIGAEWREGNLSG